MRISVGENYFVIISEKKKLYYRTFTKNFLRAHPQIRNDSLFAYSLVLLKRLPDLKSKRGLCTAIETVIEEYKDDIDMELIGFPDNYKDILKNNISGTKQDTQTFDKI